MGHTLTLYRSRYEPNSQNVADVGNHSRYLAYLENMGSDYTLTIEGVQYHKNNEPFRVKHSYDYIISMGFNYCKFKSDYADYVPEYDWAGEYYYFIVGVEYVNNNDTLLHVIPDYWHTYSPFLTTSSFDSVQLLRRCIYSGETPLPYTEDYNVSDFQRVFHGLVSDLDPTHIVFEVSEVPFLNGSEVEFRQSTGYSVHFLNETTLRSPVGFLCRELQHNINDLADIVNMVYEYNSANKTDSIINAYYANLNGYDTTNAYVYDRRGFKYLSELTQIEVFNTYDVPLSHSASLIHPKIFTSQFTNIILSSANGSKLTLHPELLEGTQNFPNNITFTLGMVSNISPCQDVKIYPVNYTYQTADCQVCLTATSYPMVPILNSTYLSWLSRNSSQLSVTERRNNYEIASSGVAGVTNIVGSSISAGLQFASGDPTGIFSAANSSLASFDRFVNAGFNMEAFNAMKNDATNVPVSARSTNPVTSDETVARCTFTVYMPSAKEIVELSKYFYSCGVKVAEFYGSDFYWEMSKHKYFDFIQTSSVCIKDLTPQARIAIENMLNRGIRIFHDDYWVETMYKPDNTTN